MAECQVFVGGGGSKTNRLLRLFWQAFSLSPIRNARKGIRGLFLVFFACNGPVAWGGLAICLAGVEEDTYKRDTIILRYAYLTRALCALIRARSLPAGVEIGAAGGCFKLFWGVVKIPARRRGYWVRGLSTGVILASFVAMDLTRGGPLYYLDSSDTGEGFLIRAIRRASSSLVCVAMVELRGARRCY